MERLINKWVVLVIAGLVTADLLTHGAVTTALADTFFGGKGFFTTTANLIAGK
ncbi:MAG: hypothetical protein ABSD62_14735 [Candidatus Limnocylindrales bacterium]|jgi:hypothetical protein